MTISWHDLFFCHSLEEYELSNECREKYWNLLIYYTDAEECLPALFLPLSRLKSELKEIINHKFPRSPAGIFPWKGRKIRVNSRVKMMKGFIMGCGALRSELRKNKIPETFLILQFPHVLLIRKQPLPKANLIYKNFCRKYKMLILSLLAWFPPLYITLSFEWRRIWVIRDPSSIDRPLLWVKTESWLRPVIGRRKIFSSFFMV